MRSQNFTPTSSLFDDDDIELRGKQTHRMFLFWPNYIFFFFSLKPCVFGNERGTRAKSEISLQLVIIPRLCFYNETSIHTQPTNPQSEHELLHTSLASILLCREVTHDFFGLASLGANTLKLNKQHSLAMNENIPPKYVGGCWRVGMWVGGWVCL